MRTVLITGSSSGIGRAAAELFARRGWRVLASMRRPEGHPLGEVKNVELVTLDVTDANSVAGLFATLQQDGVRLDSVINNAGYAVHGPFEPTPLADIERQFATNVFGLMRVTQAALPLLRAGGGGTIVNIASVGGKMTTPLYSTYHATKWAVEGFSESLAREVAPFNIQVKVVEPGVIRTDFYGRSRDDIVPTGEYADVISRTLRRQSRATSGGVSAAQLAPSIYKAATSRTDRLRYSYPRAVSVLFFVRRLLPDRLYLKLQRRLFG